MIELARETGSTELDVGVVLLLLMVSVVKVLKDVVEGTVEELLEVGMGRLVGKLLTAVDDVFRFEEEFT